MKRRGHIAGIVSFVLLIGVRYLFFIPLGRLYYPVALLGWLAAVALSAYAGNNASLWWFTVTTLSVADMAFLVMRVFIAR